MKSIKGIVCNFLNRLSLLEIDVYSLQNLLIWERPYVSAVALIAINCLFWVMVFCCRHFYTFVAVVGLFIFLYNSWVQFVRPKIRVNSQLSESQGQKEYSEKEVPGCSLYFREWQITMERLVHDYWRLREVNHGLFCVITCFGMIVLSVIGNFVPDVITVYTLVMIMSLGPGLLLYVVPASWHGKMKELVEICSAQEKKKIPEECLTGENTDNESELDEFLPPASTESIAADLSLSEDKSNNKYVSNSRSTSSLTQPDPEELQTIVQELGIETVANEDDDSSLIQGLGNFPDVHDESEDDIEAHLPVTTQLEQAQLPQQEEIREAQHQTTTEKEESLSSESEEEVFLKGLSFSELETTDSSQRPLAVTQRPLLMDPGLDIIGQLQKSVEEEIASHLGMFTGSHPRISRSENRDPEISDETSGNDVSDYEMISEKADANS
ncbi:reticulophagy regulator 3-like [Limulus polyphemus]|uniref:Reticulophagy regulator 3-like n=1 Tax=Limulus polyphemus TaxID=6850 RepID=A0ABM1BWG8_LIMPO|nr:reticulophagy regulator 3-like [Limulus polyphemus]